MPAPKRLDVAKTQNQIDHILIDTKCRSSILDVRFQGELIDHCLVVAKVRERFTVSKHAVQKFDVEKYNLRRLRELEAEKILKRISEPNLQRI